MVATLILVAIAVLILFDWLYSSPLHWVLKRVPCEIPVPIMGSTWSALVEPMYKVWQIKYDKWKGHPIYGFHFFRTPALFVSDPGILKKIFIADADHFMSHAVTPNEEVDLFGRNLLHAEGEQWRAVRAKMSPFFSPGRIKVMASLLETHLRRFMEKLKEVRPMGPVEFQNDLMRKLSTDVVVSSSFGIESDSFFGKDKFFFNLQKELIGPKTNLKLMTNFLSPALCRVLKLTFFSKTIMERASEFVREAVKMRSRGIGVQPDFLQGMIELMEKEDLSDTKQKYFEDGTRVPKFDLDEITAQSLIMYAGGSETTASAMGFAAIELAYHQEVQEKARREILSLKKGTENGFTFEDIQSMQYLQMVINETLRKYPLIPILPRRCTKDYKLGNLKIDKGTIIIASILGIQMDPKYFPEPEKFKPERFAPGNNLIKETFFPFGLGPRTCIGMKFAMTEMLFALAKLLSTYRLFPSEKSEYPVEINPLYPNITAKNGIWLNVEPI